MARRRPAARARACRRQRPRMTVVAAMNDVPLPCSAVQPPLVLHCNNALHVIIGLPIGTVAHVIAPRLQGEDVCVCMPSHAHAARMAARLPHEHAPDTHATAPRTCQLRPG